MPTLDALPADLQLDRPRHAAPQVFEKLRELARVYGVAELLWPTSAQSV